MITSRTINRWCSNRVEVIPVGVIYFKDPVEVYLLNDYVVPVRKSFIIADLKKAGYFLGKVKVIEEKNIKANQIEEYYTNVIQ